MRTLYFALAAVITGSVAQAHAADLIIEETEVVAIESAGSPFDGFYAGVFVGYGGAKFTGVVDSNELPDDPQNSEFFPDEWSTGLVYGGYLGVGVVDGSLYYGAEVSLSGGDFGGYATDSTGDDYSTNDFSYLATIRGRIGVLATDETLLYATAGLGFIGTEFTSYDDMDEPDSYTGSTSITLPAAVVGAGVEQALTDAISLRVEGLYVAPFGEYSFEEDELVPDMDDTDYAGIDGAFQLTAGLSFHF